MNQTHTYDDAAARILATDPQRSVIVQAPAGSGKTEILIQRILRLIAIVPHSPEQVLALTFTRKAAQEMRKRVIDALILAGDTHYQPPTHQLLTHQYAQNVLKRDQQEGWKLIQSPHRLRIMTIDALCTLIVKYDPNMLLQVTSQTHHIYQQAINSLLSDTNIQKAPAFTTLLAYTHNNINKLSGLLLNLLDKRDQWLPLIINSKMSNDYRKMMENTLQEITGAHLSAVDAMLSPCIKDEICALLSFAHQNNPSVYEAYTSLALTQINVWPANTSEHLLHWQYIGEFLLSKSQQWRKKVDKRHGFVKEHPIHDSQALTEYKQRFYELISNLQGIPDLPSRLIQLHYCPDMQYDDSHWEIIESFTIILPLLIAHLQWVFDQYRCVDYNQMTQNALTVLTSNKGIGLDYTIHHLLIDEFQDTSLTHLSLLHHLVKNWADEPNRSIFCVGDPMQSIYRFRQADVSIFYHTATHGFNGVSLELLLLNKNYRSNDYLIRWINHTFSHILPSTYQNNYGSVPFSPCIAHQETDHHTVNFHILHDHSAPEQGYYLYQHLQTLQRNYPDKSIAVLVKNRSHLTSLTPHLDQNKVSYNAVDIQPLHKNQAILDLLSLTVALHDITSRLHWLSCLRAPWCNLTNHELLTLTQSLDEQSNIWCILRQWNNLPPSLQDNTKLKHFVYTLFQSLRIKGKYASSRWVENTWLALHGPLYYGHQDTSSIETYFSLLDEHMQINPYLNYEQLKSMLMAQYVKMTGNESANLHLMTIHKSKGLEFDIVVIPYLERTQRAHDAKLLLWKLHHQPPTPPVPLISPIFSQETSLEKYLKHHEHICMTHENDRLLYVAATRARQELHLITNIKDHHATDMPHNLSFLSRLSAVPKRQQYEHTIVVKKPSGHTLPSTTFQPHTNKVPSFPSHTTSWSAQDLIIPQAISPANDRDFTHLHKIIGTIIHRCCWRRSFFTPSTSQSTWIHDQLNLAQVEAREYGLDDNEMTSVMETMKSVCNNLFDARAQWIFSLSHQNAKNEYRISGSYQHTTVTGIIDRTFIDEKGIRWIIDYKASSPINHNDIETFYKTAQQHHQDQLSKYATLLAQKYHDPTIKLGLYFPLMNGWTCWDFETSDHLLNA